MAGTVLVTGAARFLGAAVVRELAARDDVDRVIGLDVVEAGHPLGDAEFVRADLRNPLLGRIVAQTGVTTVLHLSLSADQRRSGDARASERERNVIGTMQLLAACQGRASVRRFVLKSTGAVYGSSPRDPAHFTEDMPVADRGRRGLAADAIEAEGYVRALARRRPEVSTCVLRMAHVVGGGVESALTDYLTAPALAVPFGFDARLQLLHVDDAVAALVAAATGRATGVVNVAADGVLSLRQAARLLRRPTVPVPVGHRGLLGLASRRARLTALPSDETDYLLWGRCLDTRRLRSELGVEPVRTTREAFDDLLPPRAARTPAPVAGAPARRTAGPDAADPPRASERAS